MKATNIRDPEYFHKVVDCQYACPAHTPVPEYIRLIAAQRYNEAYMINWESNVFPGVLGRTCDRPCEPACRRVRVEQEPVAICRLKRVAADNKEDEVIAARMPSVPVRKNGKRIALIGAGPASLTVARDLLPLGYQIEIHDEQTEGGGMMLSQIPAFRLPVEVLRQEVNYVLDMGVVITFNHYVDSLKAVLAQGYDAIFVGTGAPRGKDPENLPGRAEAAANIHIGMDWLSSVAFEHIHSIGKKVLVLGGGNTAMDCCRTSRRLGGEEVRVVVRSPFADMKASPWEKEDAMREDIPIHDNHVPKEFVVEAGRLKGVRFEKVLPEYDETGRRTLVPAGEAPVFMEADDVLMAIGQENSFPWIERDIGLKFGQWDMPVVDETTLQSSLDRVFFGGDSAWGPENIITAVAHGHQAAISIDLLCRGQDVRRRPRPGVNLVGQKMGIHQWSYDNLVESDQRYLVVTVRSCRYFGPEVAAARRSVRPVSDRACGSASVRANRVAMRFQCPTPFPMLAITPLRSASIAIWQALRTAPYRHDRTVTPSAACGQEQVPERPQSRSGTGLRSGNRLQGSPALPELRCTNRISGGSLHRV